MQGTLKTVSLESCFPLLAVEQGCIVSKNGDLTVAFRVKLPEVFTQTAAEYESLHSVWCKALAILPDYTVVHKQDYFIEERYRSRIEAEESFLSRSFERHFNERPYLHHSCYLLVTRTTKERIRQRSDFSSLCRGALIPREALDSDAVTRFLESVAQAESILNESGSLHLRRLSAEEIVGTASEPGLLERYFSLCGTAGTVEDLRLDAGSVRIGERTLSLHTLSDLDDIAQMVATDTRYERLSTDRSDCRLSFASPVGLLLGCSHILNQYVFLDDNEELLRTLERTSRNMNSLSRYSRSNAVNREWIEEYLNEAHANGWRSVRCHVNVVAWGESDAELKKVRNEVGAQIALMGCTPHHNTVDVPVLFWAGIPGNEGDFPAEESFTTFLEPAVCFFALETCGRDSASPFGIRLVDRLTGVPVLVDISDEPMKRGVTTNRNKFVLGPSGSGKSFFTNHMARQYYEQGTHILLVDTGNSYQGLCELIRRRTHGEDGIYLTCAPVKAIA